MKNYIQPTIIVDSVETFVIMLGSPIPPAPASPVIGNTVYGGDMSGASNTAR